MHYALTINSDNIISGVHESLNPIADTTFAGNPELYRDRVVVISALVEFRTNEHILCYHEDGTRKPDLWCIEHGYMALPPNQEIINGELIDKQVPAEAQPQTLKEFLEEQLGNVRQDADKRFTSLKPIMTRLVKDQPADLVIGISEFILPWSEGKYALGEVRLWESQPKRCCQAHDSTGNSAWTPAVASLWAPFHATTAENALPWVAPSGAQDMYKKDEYMIFTNEQKYKCLADTVYSPADYPQAWQAISE